jgi:hypothetical protein
MGYTLNSDVVGVLFRPYLRVLQQASEPALFLRLYKVAHSPRIVLRTSRAGGYIDSAWVTTCREPIWKRLPLACPLRPPAAGSDCDGTSQGSDSLPHQIRHLLSGPCRALECQPQRFRAFVRAVVKPAQRVTSSFGGGCSATKKRECPFALRATHLALIRTEPPCALTRILRARQLPCPGRPAAERAVDWKVPPPAGSERRRIAADTQPIWTPYRAKPLSQSADPSELCACLRRGLFRLAPVSRAR